LTVSGINDRPVLITPIGDQIAKEDEGFLIDVSDRFSDPDGDSLTFEASGLPTSLTISRDGVIAGTPTQAEVGEYPVTVIARDPAGEQASDAFTLTVQASNDTPLLDEEIPDQQAIENELFLFDVSGFFSDPDEDELRFSATGLPDSGNLEIDELSGVISGTPSLDDTRDFPYDVTISARDPDEATAAGNFQLTVAALDRANASMEISVTPSPALLDDETRWTFSAGNSGPDSIDNLRLAGSFYGQQLRIDAVAPSNCVITAGTASTTSFECSLGLIENGGTAFAVFAVASNRAGDITAEAAVSAEGSLPVDPNPANNSDQQSVSVAESFSNGSVQQLGESNVRSMATGDLDGDGDLDLVLGTAAGQLIELYFGSGYRTFIEDPLPIADNASNDGIGLGDIDGDGDIDMIVANTGNQPNRLFVNDGNGNFQLTAEIEGPDSRDVVVEDINGDGFLDIVFATVVANTIYLGDGNGGFALSTQIGNASSHAVQAADLDGDGRPDLVFANVGAPSRVWFNRATAPFQTSTALAIGDAVGVAAADLDNDGDTDLAFGRIPSQVGDIAANPVLLNDGAGFMQVDRELGTAASYQVLAGDIDNDGFQDLVFISATGTHQVWQGSATGFVLNGMQIEQASAVTGVLNDLGNDDGMDLALGGGALAGASLYLNDGDGNLGMGDAVPPTITLIGDPVFRVPAGSPFIDPGAIAEDNIDGDLTNSVQKSGAVNTQVVGDYNIVYSVRDSAGNEAQPTVRKVTVVPAAGTGGGGGGAIGPAAFLGIILLLVLGNRRYRLS
jgi:hypothetical protein